MSKLIVYKDHEKHPFGNIFQIRWKESLGLPECPYLYRWTLILFHRSIRLHHWLRSDDRRFYHDHSSDLISIVLKGKYTNVNPIIKNKEPEYLLRDEEIRNLTNITINTEEKGLFNQYLYPVEGIFNSWKNFFHPKNSIWFSKAETQHYLDIPKGGAWTLLLEGKKYHKWGFYVKGHKWRPLRYFSKFGVIQTKDYQ
jgi:hypothetical protein